MSEEHVVVSSIASVRHAFFKTPALNLGTRQFPSGIRFFLQILDTVVSSEFWNENLCTK